MPRYVYHCSSCEGDFQVRHGIKEVQEVCQLCQEVGNLRRIPQMPRIAKKREQNQKVGSLTKDYIEQNRELLKEMKRDSRNVEYDG